MSASSTHITQRATAIATGALAIEPSASHRIRWRKKSLTDQHTHIRWRTNGNWRNLKTAFFFSKL